MKCELFTRPLEWGQGDYTDIAKFNIYWEPNPLHGPRFTYRLFLPNPGS